MKIKAYKSSNKSNQAKKYEPGMAYDPMSYFYHNNPVQAKLQINPANDKYEQERLLQSRSSSEQKSQSYQSKSRSLVFLTPEIEKEIKDLQGKGVIVPDSLRDFNDVKIHNDTKAHELAQSNIAQRQHQENTFIQ